MPESKLHINYLELKAVLLALKEFQNLCTNKIVLVATDNTTVVAYINKEGVMKSGPLCALLWRILTWCSQRQVTLKAISSQPFLKPSSSSQPSDRPATSVPPATDHVDVTTASKAGSDSSQPCHDRKPQGFLASPLRGPFPLPLIYPEGKARPVTQTQKVLLWIDLQLICTRKRVNYLTTMKFLSPTPTNPSLKNSLTEKL